MAITLNKDQMQAFAWAAAIIQDHMVKGSYGTVTIAMANGKVSGVKCEINHKPDVDPKGMIP